MDASAFVQEHRVDEPIVELVGDGIARLGSGLRRGRGAGRAPGLALVTAGLLGAVIATIGMSAGATRTSRPSLGPGPSDDPAATKPRLSGHSLGAADSTESVVLVTYGPGQSSGWHRHAGWHAVTVLSGALTVDGDDCQRRVYGTGDQYIGGPARHRATNEGTDAVEMAVRWIAPVGVGSAELAQPQQEPDGCPLISGDLPAVPSEPNWHGSMP